MRNATKGPVMKKDRARRTTKYDPNTQAAVIVDRFGGVQRMSDETGLSPSTIYSWLTRGGLIPPRQVQVLMEHADRLKIKIKPTDWLVQRALPKYDCIADALLDEGGE